LFDPESGEIIKWRTLWKIGCGAQEIS
jgi:hypothetical protein